MRRKARHIAVTPNEEGFVLAYLVKKDLASESQSLHLAFERADGSNIDLPNSSVLFVDGSPEVIPET